MFAVAGVTGNTGSVVVDTLLARGQKVRAIVRSADRASALAARGVEVVVASLDDPDRLAGALEGVDGAYLLIAPDRAITDIVREGRRLAEQLATAVARARVPHVVVLSSVAAQQTAGTGPIVYLHHAEQRLAEAAPAATFVRAAYFIDNLAALIPVAREQGVLPSMVPTDLRFPMVSTRDIGRVAAEALLTAPAGRRVIELAGPRDVSFDDAAGVLRTILGREVRAVRIPHEAVVPTLIQGGMSANLAGLYREMSDGIASGVVAFEGVAPVTRGTTDLSTALAALAG